MATGALIGATVLSAGSSYLGAKGAKKQAKRGKDAARREAEFIEKRNAMEQSIAKEKFELEIAMETERMEHETRYIVGQLEKQKARASGEATAGYAASGVTLGEGGSSEAVLKRIESEFESDVSMVRKTAALELEQFTTGKQKSLDWFMEQSTMETEYGVQSSLSEAEAYKSRADFAGVGMALGPLAAGLGGAAQYGMYKEITKKPMTIQ